MILFRRHLRLIAAAGIAWLVAESVIFWLCVQSIGVFPTLAFLMLKGAFGLVLLVSTVRGVLRALTQSRFKRGASHFATTAFVSVGALLILIPGFLATLAGVALFSPSVRSMILKFIRRERRRTGRNEIVALERSEWREVSARKPRRNAKTRSIAP